MEKRRKRILAISYGDESFSMSRNLNLWTAKYVGGASETAAFGPEDIDNDFYMQHKHIMDQKRGGGYWLWKPYILLKAMELIAYGEYLIYTDAGMIYVRGIQHLIRQLERDGQDIFLSSGFVPAREWSKRDSFVLMNCDKEEAKSNIMVSAGYVLLRKSNKSLSFLTEWMEYSKDERILTDCENQCGLPNDTNFHEHRHDQSIVSNLAYLYGIEAYKGVTHVDEPRAHIKALKGNVDSYRYTFFERLERIKKQHQLPGYQRSDYPRIFINTRIRNGSNIMFGLRVIYRILNAIYTDLWGYFNDKRYLERKNDTI